MSLESIFNKIKEEESLRITSLKDTEKAVPTTASIAQVSQKQTDKPSVSLEKKEENLAILLEDIQSKSYSKLFSIFENHPNRELQIDNNGSLSFVVEINEGSKESLEHIATVKSRAHRFTQLDAIDGEAMFIYLMNPILEHLEFDTRYLIDGRSYKGLGDNGDFKFGSKRLDIKTRQVKSTSNKSSINLLVNESTINNKFNFYGLVHREGDAGKEGYQRRLTFVGTATHEKVIEKPAFVLGRSGKADENTKNKKFEVNQNELNSLHVLISEVCLELIQRGGTNP